MSTPGSSTGGIGEHAPPVREGICTRLANLGVRLDPSRNSAGAAIISADGSSYTVRVVPADEERSLAQHTARVLTEIL
jgi:acetate kinase